MPNARKRYRKNTRRVKKTTALTRTGAKSQAYQILKLQKQVDKIHRNVVDNTKWTQYQFPLSASVGGALITSPSYSVWNLIQPVQWDPIFQTRPSGIIDTMTPSKFRGRSIGLEVMAQIGNYGVNPIVSYDPITVTMFICSLRKETSAQFLQETTNGTALSEDVHYCRTSMGLLQGEGMVMLNKGYFRIKHTRRFMLGGNVDFVDNGPDDTPVHTTNLRDNNKRFFIKIPYSNLIKDAGPNTRSSTAPVGFKSMSINDVEPMDQLYVYFFSNAYEDQAVSVHANMIITGTTAN